MNLRSVRRMFGRSPTTSRPMAEWRWNDTLEPDRLIEQVDALLDAGLGGVFVRPGAELPDAAYLSKEWFAAMAGVARRVRRRRGSIWFAEDFASNATRSVVRRILNDSPGFAAHTIALDDIPAGHGWSRLPANALGAFAVTSEGPQDIATGARSVLSVEALSLDGDIPNEQRLLVIREIVHRDTLSSMDRSATMAFLQCTHEHYQRELKRYFGNTLGLCLLLNAGPKPPRGHVPWDAELPTLFAEIRGYELLPELAKLYFDLPGHERVRHDYWTLVDDMVREGLITPFAAWCEEQRIAGGCETIAVNTPGRSAAGYASLDFAVVRDAVALDVAHETVGTASEDLVALKTAQSVRRQLGKSGVIRIWEDTAGESLDGMVTEHASNAAIGANHASYPAAASSYRQRRKRAHGSPLGLGGAWPFRKDAFDAMSRTTWILSQGESTASVLILHPLASQRVLFRPGHTADTPHTRLQRTVCELAEALLSHQIDFDIADEDMLSLRGEAQRRELALRKRGYRHVVVPSCVNLRSSTFALLQDFAVGGGSLLVAGTAPVFLDGVRSKTLEKFFDEYGERLDQGAELGNYEELCAWLHQRGAGTVDIATGSPQAREGLIAHGRNWDGIDVVALVNRWDVPIEATASFHVEDTRQIEVWRPIDGSAYRIESHGETAEYTGTWQAGEARLFVRGPRDTKRVDREPSRAEVIERVDAAWTGQRRTPNLAIPRSGRLPGGAWSELGSLRRSIARRLGPATGPVLLTTEWQLELDGDPAEDVAWSLVVDESELLAIRVNGTALDPSAAKRSEAPGLVRLPVTHLSRGTNIIAVSDRYESAEDVTPPWLHGAFTTRETASGGTVVSAHDSRTPFGDWPTLGMPLYTGAVVYRAEAIGRKLWNGERVRLRTKPVSGACEVRVNGSVAGRLWRRRTTLDLTSFWKEGEIAIEIEVGGTFSNALNAANGEGLATRYGLDAPPVIEIVREPDPVRSEREPVVGEEPIAK